MELTCPTSPTEVEDIEDLLSVFEDTAAVLKQPGLSAVDLQCAMYKYVHLETALLTNLEQSTQQSIPPAQQRMLTEFIERYTRLGPDYQSIWPQHYWDAYSVATKGHKYVLEETTSPTLRQLGEKLQQVKDLARTLTHLTTSPDSHKSSFQRSNSAITAAAAAMAKQRLMVSKGTTENCCRCGIS